MWGRGPALCKQNYFKKKPGPLLLVYFMADPFQRPSKWMLPTSKSFRPAPYKQQVHVFIFCKSAGRPMYKTTQRGETDYSNEINLSDLRKTD